MCQPSKWWWGLAPLALIWVLANWHKAEPIAADLKARGAQAAAQASGTVPGIAPLAAAVDGRDVTVTGELRAADLQPGVSRAVDAEWGVRRVAGAMRAAQPLRPYLWTAERQGAAITLTGAVPDETTRAANLAAARAAAPGAQVVDAQRVAFGAPAGFTSAVAALLPDLGRLSSGKLTLSDGNLCLEGAAASADAYLDLRSRAASAPQGFARQACAVTPPAASPYVWAARKAASGAVAITGFYPTDQVRADINAAVRAASPGAQVTDEMRPASGAPAALLAMVQAGMAQLSRMVEGVASISDSAFTIAGRGPASFEACDALRRGVAGQMPQGATLAGAAIECPPQPQALVWSAAKSPAGITLSGMVPSEQARAAVLAAARAATSGAVTDTMTLAPAIISPPDYATATAFALAQLAPLASGQASLAGPALTLAGAAPSGAAKSTVDGALGAALPGGLRLASAAITAPPPPSPLTWSAVKNPSGIVLSGLVPSQAAREALVAAARRATPGTVTDNMTVPAGVVSPPDYAAATAFALDKLAALATGQVSLNGRALVVTGNAASQGVKSAVEAALAGALPGGVALARVDVAAPAPPPPPPPPPPSTPLAWSAVKDRNGLTLGGMVPSAEARAAVLAAARAATSGAVIDNMTVQDNLAGAPSYPAATRFVLEQLASLSIGQAQLAGSGLTVSGVAETARAKLAVDGALAASLPGGLRLGQADIAVRPYVFDAQFDRTGLVLQGYAPDRATREEVIAAAEAAGHRGRIRDEITVIGGAPSGFGPAIRASLANLLRLDMGTLRMDDRAVTLQGMTCRDPLRQEVETNLRVGLPSGFAGQGQVSMRQTGCNECQAELDRVAQGRSILFEQARSEVGSDNGTRALLDDVARVLQACVGARVAVEGHTNIDGDPVRNRNLSEARARAVVQALTQRGLAAERLSPVGFGPDRPLIPHGSEEARERNRRVQFTIIPN